jgi:hypothetical protein
MAFADRRPGGEPWLHLALYRRRRTRQAISSRARSVRSSDAARGRAAQRCSVPPTWTMAAWARPGRCRRPTDESLPDSVELGAMGHRPLAQLLKIFLGPSSRRAGVAPRDLCYICASLRDARDTSLRR